jgi:DNA-binding transcriptional LysR family regulator
MTEEYNLYPLHVFCVVARFGSVTRAAQELCISQPAVSFHIRSLETRYEELLFERTPRGMKLTVAGGEVAAYAHRVFATLKDLDTAVQATREEVKGEVVVAASSTPGTYLVPRLLRRFQERYPEAKPTLVVGDSAEVVTWLEDYRVPIGIVGEGVKATGLLREPVGADELRLVVRADDALCDVAAITGEQLVRRTLFLREEGSSTRVGTLALLGPCIQHFERTVTMGSTEAIKQMVIAGLGVAILSSWTTEVEEQASLLRPVPDLSFRQKRRFFAVRREDRPLPGTIAALWNCLTNCSGKGVGIPQNSLL